MPYRAVTDRCALCHRPPVVGSCERCGSPLCLEHLPLANKCCDACEDEYWAFFHEKRLGCWAAVGPALATPLLVWLVAGLVELHGENSWYGVYILTIMVFVLAGAFYAAVKLPKLRARHMRNRFLAERSSAAAKTAPPALRVEVDPSEHDVQVDAAATAEVAAADDELARREDTDWS